MSDNRREFMIAGMLALAAPVLSERLIAAGAALPPDQQPPANPSRAVATKDAPKVNLMAGR